MSGFEQQTGIAVIFGLDSTGSAPRRQRGADRSNFCVLSKGERVFYVDSEIAHCVLDLAMAEEYLDSAQVTGAPMSQDTGQSQRTAYGRPSAAASRRSASKSLSYAASYASISPPTCLGARARTARFSSSLARAREAFNSSIVGLVIGRF